MSDDRKFNISADSYRAWRGTTEAAEPSTLTVEKLRAFAEAAKNEKPREHIEYHHPSCPKVQTQGRKACRCGGSPLEAMFEDALEGK